MAKFSLAFSSIRQFDIILDDNDGILDVDEENDDDDSNEEL